MNQTFVTTTETRTDSLQIKNTHNFSCALLVCPRHDNDNVIIVAANLS